MNPKELLSKYWAKSDGTTIREHTDKLLENLRLLKDFYQTEIEKLIPEGIPKELKERFWWILELACEYHDYGKLHSHFQSKVGNPEVKPDRNLPEVRHNLLSPAFVQEEDQILKKLVRVLVLNHHPVESVEVNKVETVLRREFGLESSPLNFMLKKEETAYLREDIAQRHRLPEESLLGFYRLLKGLLLRIDHASSSKEANLVEDVPPEDTLDFLERFFEERKQKLNKLQVYVKENRDKNLVVIAPTGSGKTEAGFIFLKKKGFFMLPYRVSANGLYVRMKKIFKKELGLLHSSALNHLLNNEDENQEHISSNKEDGMFLNYYLSKNFAKPLIVCTPDQLMHFVFKYKGFEKYYATALCSRLVIDEIQSYDPITLAFMVKALEVLGEQGGRFLVMTATFPDFLRENFERIGAEFCTLNLQDRPYHHVEIVEEAINSEYTTKRILKLSKTSKVLVITNTVKRAQELYHILRELGAHPKLLHSRFILRDRNEREVRIKEFFDGGGCGVWITTQLAEVSLDLDADYLFTELSTPDSLIQRMGRCNRRGLKPTEKPNVFVFTEDCSGIGPVYFKDLHQRTKGSLREGFWGWEEKWRLMDSVYSKEEIKNTNYNKRFNEAYTYIHNLWEGKEVLISSKGKAQELFRDIDAETVIPMVFKKEVDKLFEDLENTKGDIKKKVELLVEIFNYSLQLPAWSVNGLNKEVAHRKLGIYFAEGEYDPDIGFKLSEVKDTEQTERKNFL